MQDPGVRGQGSVKKPVRLNCPFCQRRRVRVNYTSYSFTRYRCDYCGSEWHSRRAFEEGMAGADRIAPINPNLLIEVILLRDKLQHWGGKTVEFLDNFEGSFEDDELAQEALALQEEGLNLGMKRIYPPQKEEEKEEEP